MSKKMLEASGRSRSGRPSTLSARIEAVRSLNEIKSPFDAISTKIERAGLASVFANQVPSGDTWSRGNSEDQPIQEYKSSPANGQGQEDTQSRDELVTIIPTIEQSTSTDTWTRDEGVYAVKEESRVKVRADVHQGTVLPFGAKQQERASGARTARAKNGHWRNELRSP
jgi:hypothetical protein